MLEVWRGGATLCVTRWLKLVHTCPCAGTCGHVTSMAGDYASVAMHFQLHLGFIGAFRFPCSCLLRSRAPGSFFWLIDDD